MDKMTIGREIYPGMQVMLWHGSSYDFSNENSETKRLGLILIEDGTGILRLGEHKILLAAPMILCINEQDKPYLEQGMNLKCKALFFTPDFVNSDLNFENFRDGYDSLSPTTKRDFTLLKPFSDRSTGYLGCISLSISAARKMSELFSTADAELESQKDWFWPCRSRSYLLEILFLIQRIFLDPTKDDNEIRLTGTSSEIDAVIIYLHTNYCNKITMAEIANEFHTNRTTLNEKFTKATGITIIEYLIRLRIRLASMMLRDTMIPVSEILERVGFKDNAHFNRMFNKYIGYSPSAYRNSFNLLGR